MLCNCGHDERWLAYRNPVDATSAQYCLFCEQEKLNARIATLESALRLLIARNREVPWSEISADDVVSFVVAVEMLGVTAAKQKEILMPSESKPMKWSELRERVAMAAKLGGIETLLDDLGTATPAMEEKELAYETLLRFGIARVKWQNARDVAGNVDAQELVPLTVEYDAAFIAMRAMAEKLATERAKGT